MLRKLAVALVAASVLAAPVLAQTGSTGTPAAKPAVTAPATTSKAPAAPVKHIKANRHTGKQVRHVSRHEVAKLHRRHGVVVKSARYSLSGAKLAVHKGSQSGLGTVR
jgi:hypothetical protein